MASTLARSTLRTAFRGCPRVTAPPRRNFSKSHHDDAYETVKWQWITCLGIVVCSGFAVYILRNGHPHHAEPLPYPYLHIRNKEFPWGPDGLFEVKDHH